MACRTSCKSGLGLLPRAASSSSLSSGTRVASPSSLLRSRRIAVATTPQQQIRGIHATLQCRQQQQTDKSSGGESSSSGGGLSWLTQRFKEAAGSTAQPYLVYRTTERLVKACASKADYKISSEERKAGTVKQTADGEEIGTGGGMWHDDFHLLPTFSTWAHVTMLHMYLLVVRLRALDKDAHHTWQSQLVDHFFHQAEDKMDVEHDMGSRTMRQRYLRDLFVQWRGLMLAYDEGLARGDAVLASAVWRNLFKARDDVDVRVLAAIVSWMRLSLMRLDQIKDEDLPLLAEGAFKWPAKSELLLVDLPARGLEGAETVKR
ncbi:ubiquinol-cytochrome C chaperone-domain-containing protein [Bombardia bombarda]|uniref:Ubiquinol-cytochrome C chaperone-domain-containing protein n=1 Tax=Bombardia bombarda TaxID=252184 RepID=A0AA39XB03_9PEZI|nr:ubiquinol-cytochrome C chaperone-domain-containing protein [Bombardia bombarda]